jgi:hypothetical protein
MYRLDQKLAGFEPVGGLTFEAWLDSFQYLYGGIDLFGGSWVREPIERVKAIVDKVGMEAQAAGSQQPFEPRFAAAYPAHRDELTSAVGEAIEAMREDILISDPREAIGQ